MSTTRLKRFIKPKSIHKGDYFEINCNYNTDITGFDIRAEIWDNYGNKVRKASSGVTGGGSSQIAITTATSGLFTIYINNNETTFFKGDIRIEIELTDTSSNTFVVHSDYLELQDQRISWSSL